MPRTLAPIPDPVDSTDGMSMNVLRVPGVPGAAGAQIRLNVPGDPGGDFTITAADLSAAQRTALKTVTDAVIALFRTARGYT